MASRSWIAGLALGLFLTACATTTEIDRRFLGVVTHVDPASRHVTFRELRPDGTIRETRVIVNSLTRIQGPGGPAGLGDLRPGQEYDVTARRDVDGENWAARSMTLQPPAR